MEPSFTKKRSEKRLKLGFPLEVNLVTAAGQVPLGRGVEDISRSGCRLKRCQFATGAKLAAGLEYPVVMRFRQDSFPTRILLVWLSPAHCGLRLTEPVPFWPVKF